MATGTIRTRPITSSESFKFLQDALAELDYLKVNWDNHKKAPRTKDTYQLTMDKLSDEAIARLVESEKVSDVYYCASMPPSGMGYGVDLRYRVYIRYNKIEIKSRKKKASKSK
jgi:hypothetical protein|tara:strand:- start:566 stop:904 length:339 start_codon:yes stop_codon:yes gene_type:complete